MGSIEVFIFFVLIWIGLNNLFVRFLNRSMGIFEGFGYSLITMFFIAAMIGKYGHRTSLTQSEIATSQQVKQNMRNFKHGNRDFYTDYDAEIFEELEEQEDMEKDPTELYFRR